MVEKLRAIILLLKSELPFTSEDIKALYEKLCLIIGILSKEKATNLQEKLDLMFTKADIEGNEKDFRLHLSLFLLELYIAFVDIDLRIEENETEIEVEIKDNKLNVDNSEKSNLELEIKDNKLDLDKSKKNNILINFFNYGIIGNNNTVIEDVNNHNKHLKQFND